MTELIVHIGDGKTGSTSIQRTLDAGRAELSRQSIAYLGRTLEHCTSTEPFGWQTPEGAARLLHQMDPETAADQIFEVLAADLETLDGAGVRTAIWSNEALCARHEAPIRALTRLQEAGVRLRVVLYVRRHDHWARSAYAQWGVRHKSYLGQVKSFKDWIAERPVAIAGKLRRWDDAMGDVLDIRNFHGVGDVVGDFLSLAGARDIDTVQAYETPPPAVLAAWAVYNSQSENEVLPDRFARLLNPSGLLHETPVNLPEPADLMPSAEDLAQLLEASGDDLAAVNAALRARGQDDLDGVPPAKGTAPPGTWEMLQLTLQMVFSLQEQVLQLKRQLRDLDENR